MQNYGVEDEWWFACYASSKNQASIFLLHWGGDEANLHHAFSRISSCASKDYASLWHIYTCDFVTTFKMGCVKLYSMYSNPKKKNVVLKNSKHFLICTKITMTSC